MVIERGQLTIWFGVGFSSGLGLGFVSGLGTMHTDPTLSCRRSSRRQPEHSTWIRPHGEDAVFPYE